MATLPVDHAPDRFVSVPPPTTSASKVRVGVTPVFMDWSKTAVTVNASVPGVASESLSVVGSASTLFTIGPCSCTSVTVTVMAWESVPPWPSST